MIHWFLQTLWIHLFFHFVIIHFTFNTNNGIFILVICRRLFLIYCYVQAIICNWACDSILQFTYLQVLTPHVKTSTQVRIARSTQIWPNKDTRGFNKNFWYTNMNRIFTSFGRISQNHCQNEKKKTWPTDEFNQRWVSHGRLQSGSFILFVYYWKNVLHWNTLTDLGWSQASLVFQLGYKPQGERGSEGENWTRDSQTRWHLAANTQTVKATSFCGVSQSTSTDRHN